MNFNQPAILQPYWDLALANVKADALRIALEWDVFRRLNTPKTASDIATSLGVDSSNMGYVLELLWSMDLLEREPGDPVRYHNQDIAQHYFASDAERYLGDAFLFRLAGLRHFGGQLAQQVQSGMIYSQAPDAVTTQENWAKAANVQIAQEQRAITTGVVQEFMTRIPEFQQGGCLLDLGGGPGLIAISLVQTYPLWSAAVFDFPETVKVAQSNIDKAGLTERITVMGGDLATDPIGDNFDLIWCSSVLHFMPDIEATLTKIWAALKPGGVFISAHAEVPMTATAARKILPYYLAMRMKGCHVTQQDELAARMSKVGFTRIEQHPQVAFPVAPVTVIIARKEAL
ncbi:methyltransferase [uncultured Cedecea sp.]|uniref:methyltransferase n=1 Tax=uncultured Cedecea sp. TaxID=988762 RepID=UPI002608442A|nr:methyltransferase [uncultured Cedecea sp.]